MELPRGYVLFQEYVNELKTKNRFFPDRKYRTLFDYILSNNDNLYTIEPDTSLYRARKNKPNEHFKEISSLGMNKSSPGANRASPIGIPYIYLSDEIETTIAEIRSNVQDRITVARFAPVRPLQIVVLSSFASYSENPFGVFSSADIGGFTVFLSNAFATAVTKKEEINYIPCQYFAEYCKTKGFDGIRYVSAAMGQFGSNVHEYNNYVLFDEASVRYIDAAEYTVQGIHYDISAPTFITLK